MWPSSKKCPRPVAPPPPAPPAPGPLGPAAPVVDAHVAPAPLRSFKVMVFPQKRWDNSLGNIGKKSFH